MTVFAEINLMSLTDRDWLPLPINGEQSIAAIMASPDKDEPEIPNADPHSPEVEPQPTSPEIEPGADEPEVPPFEPDEVPVPGRGTPEIPERN